MANITGTPIVLTDPLTTSSVTITIEDELTISMSGGTDGDVYRQHVSGNGSGFNLINASAPISTDIVYTPTRTRQGVQTLKLIRTEADGDVVEHQIEITVEDRIEVFFNGSKGGYHNVVAVVGPHLHLNGLTVATSGFTVAGGTFTVDGNGAANITWSSVTVNTLRTVTYSGTDNNGDAWSGSFDFNVVVPVSPAPPITGPVLLQVGQDGIFDTNVTPIDDEDDITWEIKFPGCMWENTNKWDLIQCQDMKLYPWQLTTPQLQADGGIDISINSSINANQGSGSGTYYAYTNGNNFSGSDVGPHMGASGRFRFNHSGNLTSLTSSNTPAPWYQRVPATFSLGAGIGAQQTGSHSGLTTNGDGRERFLHEDDRGKVTFTTSAVTGVDMTNCEVLAYVSWNQTPIRGHGIPTFATSIADQPSISPAGPERYWHEDYPQGSGYHKVNIGTTQSFTFKRGPEGLGLTLSNGNSFDYPIYLSFRIDNYTVPYNAEENAFFLNSASVKQISGNSTQTISLPFFGNYEMKASSDREIIATNTVITKNRHDTAALVPYAQLKGPKNIHNKSASGVTLAGQSFRFSGEGSTDGGSGNAITNYEFTTTQGNLTNNNKLVYTPTVMQTQSGASSTYLLDPTNLSQTTGTCTTTLIVTDSAGNVSTNQKYDYRYEAARAAVSLSPPIIADTSDCSIQTSYQNVGGGASTTTVSAADDHGIQFRDSSGNITHHYGETFVRTGTSQEALGTSGTVTPTLPAGAVVTEAAPIVSSNDATAITTPPTATYDVATGVVTYADGNTDFNKLRLLLLG